ncbi:MAG: group 1 glycosyl transferase, partial [Candidatus Berkelbacteria bacterium Licking1014_2]
LFAKNPAWRLKIAGAGVDESRLKKLAGSSPNIEFLGRVSDNEIVKLYQQAKAYIFPALEDFGITPLEAMACGCPVLAYGVGGATETVVNQKTGLLFSEQTSESLKQAIEKSEKMIFKTDDIVNRAKEFSEEKFASRFKNFVENEYNKLIKSP